MEPQKVLVVDGNAVCYSAYFTSGMLKNNDRHTGIIYGFFNQVLHACINTGATHIAFCWDSRQSRRKIVMPEYKANRKKDPDLLQALEQVSELYKDIIPRLNFTNNFFATGFEADDLIASLCMFCPPKEGQEYFILSSDHDLYQLLSPQVSMYKLRTKRIYTVRHFQEEFGITPLFWPDVKAIAGCSSDNIPGIPGIGEKTAIQFLKNSCSSKRHEKIESKEGKRIRLRNLPLVRLPLERTPRLQLDWGGTPSFAEWLLLCEELGFNSFLDNSEEWEFLFSQVAQKPPLYKKLRFGNVKKYMRGHETVQKGYLQQ